MSEWRGVECCGKRSYATEQAAERVLRLVAATATGRHPIRMYRCPNGWIHLTSQPHHDAKEPA